MSTPLRKVTISTILDRFFNTAPINELSESSRKLAQDLIETHTCKANEQITNAADAKYRYFLAAGRFTLLRAGVELKTLFIDEVLDDDLLLVAPEYEIRSDTEGRYVRITDLEFQWLLERNQPGFNQTSMQKDLVGSIVENENDGLVKLLNSPLFRSLSANKLQQLITSAQKVEVDRDFVVIKDHSPATHLYIVESGYFSLNPSDTTRHDDDMMIANDLRSGDVFGEDAILDNGLYTYSVVAKSHGTLLKLSRSRIFDVILDGTVTEFYSDDFTAITSTSYDKEKYCILTVDIDLEPIEKIDLGILPISLEDLRFGNIFLSKDKVYILIGGDPWISLRAHLILTSAGIDNFVYRSTLAELKDIFDTSHVDEAEVPMMAPGCGLNTDDIAQLISVKKLSSIVTDHLYPIDSIESNQLVAQNSEIIEYAGAMRSLPELDLDPSTSLFLNELKGYIRSQLQLAAIELNRRVAADHEERETSLRKGYADLLQRADELKKQNALLAARQTELRQAYVRFRKKVRDATDKF